jgi:hypothetical protein
MLCLAVCYVLGPTRVAADERGDRHWALFLTRLAMNSFADGRGKGEHRESFERGDAVEQRVAQMDMRDLVHLDRSGGGWGAKAGFGLLRLLGGADARHQRSRRRVVQRAQGGSGGG